MSYFLAPAHVALRAEVDRVFPRRDKASDGWIGDSSHAARVSDHNPCWRCSGRSYGIVRAIDVDIRPDGRDDLDLATLLLKATIGDPRVWYVIHRGKIYSRSYGWAARVYTGYPHDEHVHVSLNGANGINPDGCFDTRPWGLLEGQFLDKDGLLVPVRLVDVTYAATRPNSAVRPIAVSRVQGALNHRMGSRLREDGVYGPKTRATYAEFVAKRLHFDNVEQKGLPRQHSLTRLGKDRFRVVR